MVTKTIVNMKFESSAEPRGSPETVASTPKKEEPATTLKRMNRPARRGTLASIAAELGVSRTTVSNAYNRPDQLSPELRDKILHVAAKVGYPGPDPMARSLRTRRAGAIGVLLTEELPYAFEDQASLEFVSGVSVSCGSMDASMLLIPAGVDDNPTADRPAQLVNQASVDGFIVYSVAVDDPYLAAVRNRGLPTVVCDQPAAVGDPFVGIDDREAIKPAIRELVDAGHRHIGVLCIRLDRTPNNGPVSDERIQAAHMHVQRSRVLGVLDVLEEAGISDAPIVERHINNPQTAYEAAQELLTNHPELTAVACTTDSQALGVVRYAAEQGIDVPGQLSVTGFDGIPEAFDAHITTVRQPSKDKGLESGNMLSELIEQRLSENPAKPARRAAAPSVLLETELIRGTSVAAPQ